MDPLQHADDADSTESSQSSPVRDGNLVSY